MTSPRGPQWAGRLPAVYFTLLLLPFPLNLIPWLESVTVPIDRIWSAGGAWLGRVFFGVAVAAPAPNGSGDTLAAYLQAALTVILALLLSLAWRFADRSGGGLSRALPWIRAYVRLWIAAMMLIYGLYKMVPAQFPPLTPDRLAENFGDASPMGMLWSFMSVSRPYTISVGLIELLAGVLLAFRRTALAGALLAFAIALHVFLLNLFYDIPVKLVSFQLVLACAWILTPDLRRIVTFLFGSAPVPARAEPPLLATTAGNRAIHLGKLALLLLISGLSLSDSMTQSQLSTGVNRQNPFFGNWLVTSFVSDGGEVPLASSNGERWRQINFGHPGIVRVVDRDGRGRSFASQIEREVGRVLLTSRDRPGESYVFSLTELDANRLKLEGALAGKPVSMTLERQPFDPNAVPLLNRGFHWVSEAPYNR